VEPLFAHSLKNWGEKQNPPAYVRMRLFRQARLLRQAGTFADGNKVQRMGKSLLMNIRALNPYWTGRPLSHTELARWLFSRAMLDCLSMDRRTIRVVC
jgi:hypothetical protein